MEIHHNEIDPGIVAVTVAGKVMMGAESEKIEDLVEQLLHEGKRTIIFDIGGVTTLDPVDRAGSLNPDSNYLGFATSAGAAGANVSTDPATVPLEPYSAAGPVQIGLTTHCASGAAGPCEGRPGGGFVSFPAPNWAGADGVSVSGVGGFGSGICPALVQGDCRFFGTSAAAPHAAGVAALVLQQNGGRLAPRDLNSIMSELAYPRAGTGWGAGVLRAVR